MKNLSFILFLTAAIIASTSCQPPKQGAYEAPAIGYEGQFQEDQILHPDSSVEKAIAHDTVKRTYHL